MVPVPEVRNHISGTVLTVVFFHFLARVPLQSQKSPGKRIGLRPPTRLLERRRSRLRWRLRLVVTTPHIAPPLPLVLSALRRLLSADASPPICLLYPSPPVCLLFASWLSTTGCVVDVAYAQTSLLSMRRRLRRYRDSDCRPRQLSPLSLVIKLVLLSSLLSLSSTFTYIAIVVIASRRAVAIVVDFVARRVVTIVDDVTVRRAFVIIADSNGNRIIVPLKVERARTNHKPTNGRTHRTYSISVLVRDPKNDRTGTGRAWYWKWDHTHRVQFRYGTLDTTIPELAEPSTGNGITHIESSSGTGPSE